MNLSNNLLFYWIFIGFIIVLTVGCTRYSIEGFEDRLWKSDKWGCQNMRKEMVHILKRHQRELQDLNVKEISNLLGTPDKHELLERNTRLFTYYTEPGQPCDSMEKEPENRSRLDVMIGPMGEVVDITFYE